jgi:hypothetical protein
MKTLSSFLLFSVLLFSGSPWAGKPLTLPPDFELDYEWHAATVPPPHHFEYTIRVIADGRGVINYFLNYDNTSVWTESLAVSKDTLEKVYRLMTKTGVTTKAWPEAGRHPVGGSTQWLKVVADKKTVSIPAFPRDPGAIQEVYDAIKALVPQPVWDKFSGLREEYIKNYKRTGEK